MPPGSKALNRKRLSEINGQFQTLTTALEILRQRIADARGKASSAVCASVRPEYGRRVAAIAKALEAVQAARNEYAGLVDDLEAENIAWTSLVPVALGFLGDRQDGHIARFLREAREAGYVN
ncbi:hypothetical protein [Phyllobacterium zundukense]|uniref:Uncharacterized protein n=1 Tax=Phyllobacterium zundukense TaxID=1867719 RepID=A0A2N9VS49_9HYPH|nr:hypothetical protein [Phyllobacterium zundukense]ATU92740.1 hypothetical protein BLM14_14705 [Phyllobacterium zundukense]PIO42317.1 hypothetical protein B5P45_25160 [Phyllobacterium zundukense]